MKMIVHDMQEESWQELGVRLQEKDIVISDAAACTGSEIEGCNGTLLSADSDQPLRVWRFQPVYSGCAGEVQKAFWAVSGNAAWPDTL